MDKIIANYKTCEVKNNYLMCKCSGDLSKVPDLSAKFDGGSEYWTLSKRHFTTVKNVKDYENNACVTKLQQTSGSSFVAGRVFLKNHYTVFSNSPNQISIGRVNPVVMESNQQDTGLVVAMIVVGLIFVLLALVCLCCVCFKNIQEIPHYEKKYVGQEPHVKTSHMNQGPVSVQMPPMQKSAAYQQPQVVRQVVEMAPQSTIMRQEPMMVNQQVMPGQIISSQPGQFISSQQMQGSQQVLGSQQMLSSQQPI